VSVENEMQALFDTNGSSGNYTTDFNFVLKGVLLCILHWLVFILHLLSIARASIICNSFI